MLFIERARGKPENYYYYIRLSLLSSLAPRIPSLFRDFVKKCFIDQNITDFRQYPYTFDVACAKCNTAVDPSRETRENSQASSRAFDDKPSQRIYIRCNVDPLHTSAQRTLLFAGTIRITRYRATFYT